VSSPAVLDYEHPTLTVTGRLRLYDPVAKTYLAPSGGTANVSFASTARSSAVAADGTFSVTVPTNSYLQDTPWTAYLSWTPDAATRAAFGEAFGRSFASWSVPATASSWRFVMDKPSITVKEPAGVTLSGRLDRLVGGVWTPKPDVRVRVGQLPWETTNGDGRFSFSFVPTGDFTAQVQAGDGYKLFTTYAASPVGVVDLDVVPQSELTLTLTTVSAARVFHAHGRLSYNTNAAAPAIHSVRFQKSVNGRTNWRTVRTIQTELNGIYDAKVQLGSVTGYYRVVFPESSSIQGSSTFLFVLSRAETRIGHLSITPTTIDKGDYVTFSGNVQKRLASGTYSRLGKRVKVDVTYRRSLSDTKGVVSSHWTDSTGSFSFKKRVSSAGYWSVQWRSTIENLVNAYGPERRIRIA
jgi:hypothetical protein